MTYNRKRTKFNHFRTSLAAAGLATADDNALICPLCWRDTPYRDLSLEHIVPGSVGGNEVTLTCRQCNNDQGSELDYHLAQYQYVKDALRGHGRLKSKLDVNGHEMTANVEWGQGQKNFYIVDKATNPAASRGSQEQFKAGKVKKVNFTLDLGYKRNNFNTAVLRAAYLVLFKCFGYEYARHDIVQLIRRRIADLSLEHPNPASLVFEARNFAPPGELQHFVVPGNINGVEFFLVFIRLCRASRSYVGAYMPVPVARSDEFFDLMNLASEEHDGESFEIPTTAMFW